MAKVYMVRHQRAGIITSHAFSSPPTPEQQAPILAECARVHGPGGWAIIHEAELLGDGELPKFLVPAGSGVGGAGAAASSQIVISGTGTVIPAT